MENIERILLSVWITLYCWLIKYFFVVDVPHYCVSPLNSIHIGINNFNTWISERLHVIDSSRAYITVELSVIYTRCNKALAWWIVDSVSLFKMIEVSRSFISLIITSWCQVEAKKLLITFLRDIFRCFISPDHIWHSRHCTFLDYFIFSFDS